MMMKSAYVSIVYQSEGSTLSSTVIGEELPMQSIEIFFTSVLVRRQRRLSKVDDGERIVIVQKDISGCKVEVAHTALMQGFNRRLQVAPTCQHSVVTQARQGERIVRTIGSRPARHGRVFPVQVT